MSADKRKKYATYFLGCIALYLSAVIGYSWWYARQAEHRIYRQIDETLLLASKGLKYMLAEDFQDRAIDEKAISFEEELRNRRAMNNFARDGGIKYVYTLVESGGTFYFSAPTVTEEEAHQRKRWYFYPYSDIPSMFIEAYQTGRSCYATYHDDWGVFRSIALPQISPGGRRYLSCADYEISFIESLIRREYFKSLLTALFFFLPAVPMILVYRRYNSELKSVNDELLRYQEHLEDLVAQRTSDLEKARDIAEQANRLKSRFVFNISHEIRTPMNGLIGFCEAILSSESVEDIHGYTRMILRESEVLLTLINDLLDVAKIEAGRMELDIHAFDLRGLLEEVYGATEIRTRQKRLDFQLELSDRMPRYVRGDSLRLRQVLVNLISNALKFTEQGMIKVVVECLDLDEDTCRLRFSVIDTGIGIPKDKQGRIFESFTQADVSMTRKYGGTGLGTSIASQLVELMGGRIEVESEEGKGSTFWFELLMETSSASAVKSEMSIGASAPILLDQQVGNILLADDYPTNQQIMKLFLEQEGHNLEIAGNGLEAVKSCRTRKFDIIFMDLQMPVMDGEEATRLIRKGDSLNKDVPIIALTASGEAGTQQKCLQAGMNDFIVKPIRRDALLLTVGRWLSAMKPVTQADIAIAPTDVSESSETLPVDIQILMKEFETKELVDELLFEFLHKTQEQLVTIGEAIRHRDLEVIRQESYSLKSGADSMSAMPLARLANELSLQGKEEKMEEIPQTLKAIEQELGRIQRYIEIYTTG
jgi:signal transduction histidine kinase/CheY-like chemotaxis protein/HPt (histidine-containing phosphotransfer) domain-containing protein